MLKKLFAATALVMLLAAPRTVLAQDTSEEEAVKALIQSAYVDGLQNLGDLEKTRAGFHSDFVLLGLRDGVLTKLPIAEWIASAENRKAQGQKPPLITCHFLMVDVTGSAAVAKFELHREGKHIFTDYMTLYKFPDGWKIVGKIYFRHS